MKTAAVLLALLFVATAAAVTIEHDDDAEKAKCDAEGGCHVVTLRSLQRMYFKAFAAGQAERCGL